MSIKAPFQITYAGPIGLSPLINVNISGGLDQTINTYVYDSVAGGDQYLISINPFSIGTVFELRIDISDPGIPGAQVGIDTGNSFGEATYAMISWGAVDGGTGHAYGAHNGSFFGDSDMSITSSTSIRLRGDGINIYWEANYSGIGWTSLTGSPTVTQTLDLLYVKGGFFADGWRAYNVQVQPNIN